MRQLARVIETCAWIVLMFSVACAPGLSIPSGRYETRDRAQSVTLSGRIVHFQIHLGDPNLAPVATREYDFYVAPDGRLQPVLTSVEAVYGVGMYNWRWDGETIIREDPRTGETLRFARSGPL